MSKGRGGVQSAYAYIRKLGGGGGAVRLRLYTKTGGGGGGGGAVRLRLYTKTGWVVQSAYNYITAFKPQDKRINSSHIDFKYDATRNLIFVKRVRVTQEGAAIAARGRHFIRHGGGGGGAAAPPKAMLDPGLLVREGERRGPSG